MSRDHSDHFTANGTINTAYQNKDRSWMEVIDIANRPASILHCNEYDYTQRMGDQKLSTNEKAFGLSLKKIQARK